MHMYAGTHYYYTVDHPNATMGYALLSSMMRSMSMHSGSMMQSMSMHAAACIKLN